MKSGRNLNAAEFQKRREILFTKFPPGQIPEALDILRKLPQLVVQSSPDERNLIVSYDLHQYSLEELETLLIDKGFHLDNTLMSKLSRALFYYVEETQMHNLQAPERLLKKAPEAYVRAWDQHLHGDHDDTPPEWREYK
ncbi:MAG: hypothetical protein RIR00_333 [Pseudomonadota bacterium]|jgi:hypothetical protein